MPNDITSTSSDAAELEEAPPTAETESAGADAIDGAGALASDGAPKGDDSEPPADDETPIEGEPGADLDSEAEAEFAVPSTGIPRRDQPRPRHTSEELEMVHRHAMLAAAAASSLKGEDIRILEVHELVSYTDFLVVCNGRSVRQTRRIAQEIEGRIKQELGLNPSHVAGQPAGQSAEGGEWILIDYLDFVVHVFTPEAREFYRLDTLWKEAPVEVIE